MEQAKKNKKEAKDEKLKDQKQEEQVSASKWAQKKFIVVGCQKKRFNWVIWFGISLLLNLSAF